MMMMMMMTMMMMMMMMMTCCKLLTQADKAHPTDTTEREVAEDLRNPRPGITEAQATWKPVCHDDDDNIDDIDDIDEDDIDDIDIDEDDYDQDDDNNINDDDGNDDNIYDDDDDDDDDDYDDDQPQTTACSPGKRELPTPPTKQTTSTNVKIGENESPISEHPGSPFAVMMMMIRGYWWK